MLKRSIGYSRQQNEGTSLLNPKAELWEKLKADGLLEEALAILQRERKLKKLREGAMNDPESLARVVCALAEPGFVFKDCHADWMRFAVEPPQRGGQALRMLLAPRTHGKSTVANLAACVWFLMHDPDVRILVVSNTDGQAEKFVKHLKKVLEHPTFIELFGDMQGDVWKTHELSVSGGARIRKESNVTALGMGSAIPSHHFDVIISDDVIDADEVSTETQREKAQTWFSETLEPTLTKNAIMVVIGTRWHFYDLYGWLMKQGGFTLRKYKAIIAKSSKPEMWDTYVEQVLSPDPATVDAGEKYLEDNREEMFEGTKVLLPEVYPYNVLMQWKRRRTTLVFNRQYQNDPQLGTGEKYFTETDFRYYRKNDASTPGRNDFLCVVTAHDLAISLKQSADFCAWVTAGFMKDGSIYVLDAGRDKFTADRIMGNIRKLQAHHHSDRVVIESTQFQEFVANFLKAHTAMPILKFSPSHDKGTRAMGVQPQTENHYVMFDRDRQVTLIRELVEFPFSDHDDEFDAFVMCLQVGIELADKMRRRGERKAHRYAG